MTLSKFTLLVLILSVASALTAKPQVSAFSLIEQQGEEVIFLKVTYDDTNGYIYIGAGNGNSPTVITKEEFIDLKTSLEKLDLAEFFTIIPPDAKKEYIIVVNKIDGGVDNPNPFYGIPKESTPREINDWINRLKETSKMKQ